MHGNRVMVQAMHKTSFYRMFKHGRASNRTQNPHQNQAKRSFCTAYLKNKLNRKSSCRIFPLFKQRFWRSFKLKGHYHGKSEEFLISTLHSQMPPNTPITLIEKSHTKQDRTGILRKKYKTPRMEGDCDWFLDRMSRNQSCHSGEVLNLLSVIFSLLFDISFLLHL